MRNALYAGVRTALLFANGLSWLFLGAIFGPVFLGEASFALAVTALAVAAVSFGVDSSVYYLPPTSKKFATYLLMVRIASTIVAAFCVGLIVVLLPRSTTNYLYAGSCCLLCISSTVTFIEARSSAIEGPDRVSIVMMRTLPLAILVRFISAKLTESVSITLFTVAVYEIVRGFLIYRRDYFSSVSCRLIARNLKVMLALVAKAIPFYKVNLYNVYLQKAVPTFSTFAFGPAATGSAMAHITIFDAYSSFCATYSQYIYTAGTLDKTSESLERAVRPIAIFSWVLVISIVIGFSLYSLPIRLGNLYFEPILLVVACFTMIVYGYGPMFTHWLVIAGRQKDLPNFYMAACVGITVLLVLMYPLGEIGIILARSLSSFAGYFLIALTFSQYKFLRSILCKIIIYPFCLTK